MYILSSTYVSYRTQVYLIKHICVLSDTCISDQARIILSDTGISYHAPMCPSDSGVSYHANIYLIGYRYILSFQAHAYFIKDRYIRFKCIISLQAQLCLMKHVYFTYQAHVLPYQCRYIFPVRYRTSGVCV